MTAPQQLLGPDGKTPLRRYAGYNGGGPGFGGQLIDWNAPQQSADAALLPNFYRGNARADDLVRNNGVASRRTPCSCTRSYRRQSV